MVDASGEWNAEELGEDLIALVKPELQPGERLLWASRANPRPPADHTGYYAALLWAAGFGAVGAAALAGFFGAFGPGVLVWEKPLGAVGTISGALAVLIPLISAMVWTSERSDRARTARQCYALTDRRLIVWVPEDSSRSVKIFSCSSSKINDVHRAEYPDGSGDVLFRMSDATDWRCPRALAGVANVRAVEDLVRRALLERGAGGT